jgi:O-antigen ligase
LKEVVPTSPIVSVPVPSRDPHEEVAGSPGPALTSGALLWFGGGLLLAALGECAALRFRPLPIALATIAWYGLLFAVIAWWRPSLGVLGLLVSLPLITVEVGFGDVEKTFSTDKLALGAVAAAWLVRRAGLPAAWPLARVPAVRAWMVFLGVVSLSVIGGGLAPDQIWGAAKQLVYALVFVAALDVFSREPRLVKPALAGAGVAGGVVGFLALVEWLARKLGVAVPLAFKEGTMVDESFGSTVAHMNFLSGYVILLLPLLVALAVTAGRRTRAVAVAGAAVMLLALVYANSIGAWIGLTAAAVLAAVLAARSSLPGRGRLLVAAMCAGVMLAGVGVGIRKFPGESYSVPVRVAAYRIGLAAIAERPLLGFGSNGYRRESSRLERQIYGRMLGFHYAHEPLSAHSSYLDVGVERGLPGLAAFLAVLLAVLVPGSRAALRAADPERRVLLLGLVAGLTAFALQAFTENLFSYSKVAGVFWIAAAALVALSREPGGA